MAETSTLRPFHEVALEAVREAHVSDLWAVGRFLKGTIIPEEYLSDLISAWQSRRSELEHHGWRTLYTEVIGRLGGQKAMLQPVDSSEVLGSDGIDRKNGTTIEFIP